jgi:transcriptional regulator with XRE-family HTH domain
MRSLSPKSPIPGNLRQLRLDGGLKQAELAEASGVTDATISRIERGRFAPSQDLLRRLAGALGATEADLVARERTTKAPALRRAEATLLAVVRNWEEAAIDDLVKGLRLITAAAVRSGGSPRKPTSPPGRGRR